MELFVTHVSQTGHNLFVLETRVREREAPTRRQHRRKFSFRGAREQFRNAVERHAFRSCINAMKRSRCDGSTRKLYKTPAIHDSQAPYDRIPRSQWYRIRSPICRSRTSKLGGLFWMAFPKSIGLPVAPLQTSQ